MASNIFRDGNKIIINRLDNAEAEQDIVGSIYRGLTAGYEEFEFVLTGVEQGAIYPDAAVPVAGVIDYYKSIGVAFIFPEEIPGYLKRANIFSPLSIAENIREAENFPMHKIWRYQDAREIGIYVKSLMPEISKSVTTASGVIDAIEWSLNEVMDNVLQHSAVGQGLVMCQVHGSTRTIAICVHDSGQGIYNSLKASVHVPRNALDAITLSIKEGVTRDRNVGQGNGLWGLHRIVELNEGILGIRSGAAEYRFYDGTPHTREKLICPSLEKSGTTVDFQLNCQTETSLQKAIQHSPISLRKENMEGDNGVVTYLVSKHSHGTGTRKSGERIRNDLINIYKSVDGQIVVDFSEISIVSSSFADEFIGKLIAAMGIIPFMQTFRLKNMNETVASVINKSTVQRVTSTQIERELKKEKIDRGKQ